ncbi:hypothetical protein PsorP6_015180 [Peronosclerospora sorghi]|uniref:Uncharacterized protein n=1 Tax=Peronosclerospora sorghi TaxID=230839 RepID=A0ACC0VSS9_9STRA|nr:hypothetical protein PsorP6_015180 [Peronosclerospora sorghi]
MGKRWYSVQARRGVEAHEVGGGDPSTFPDPEAPRKPKGGSRQAKDQKLSVVMMRVIQESATAVSSLAK